MTAGALKSQTATLVRHNPTRMPKPESGRSAGLILKYARGSRYPAFPHSRGIQWNKHANDIVDMGHSAAQKANRQMYKWLVMKVHRHLDASFRPALEEVCELNFGMTHQQMARQQRLEWPLYKAYCCSGCGKIIRL